MTSNKAQGSRPKNTTEEVAIKVSGVNKTFKLPHEKQNSIKGLFINMFRGKKTYEKQRVLKDISFEIKKGEFFGIVGRNGSGKSTLLKLLAGIYSPDSGHIQINGKLTPFIELGVGFNPELTGRENVFLNGALLGFNRKEMEAMYDEIVEFAELEKFMDQKLKNYSSGMQVRLAFSIAIRANTEVLILDEVLAVGDANFQKKCTDYFLDIKKSKTTVVLVTHDMESVKRFCDKALLIENGNIKASGSPTEIANQYSLDNLASSGSADSRHLDAAVRSLSVKNISPLSVSNKEDFVFEINYELNEDVDVDLGISVTHLGQSIIEHNTKTISLSGKKGKLHKIKYSLPLDDLAPKQYGIDVAIFRKEDFQLIGFNTNSCSFIVNSKNGPRGGILTRQGKWLLK